MKNNHSFCKRLNRFFFDHAFKFSFVRHPESRVVSIYNYLFDGGSGERDAKFSNFVRRECPSISEFVSKIITPGRICLHTLTLPQVYWVCDETCNIKVDKIFHFENIDQAYCELQEKNFVNSF